MVTMCLLNDLMEYIEPVPGILLFINVAKAFDTLEFKGIELPNSEEVKLSQIADDTTLICKDTTSLTETIAKLNSFGKILVLKLNNKKAKAMWIGSKNKENKARPFKINRNIFFV